MATITAVLISLRASTAPWLDTAIRGVFHGRKNPVDEGDRAIPNFGDIQVGGLPNVASAALEAAHQMAIGPGQLWSLTALNFTTSAGLVLFLDQTASPAAYSGQAVVPIYASLIGAGSASTGPGVLAPAGIPALYFTNGLWVMISSVVTTPFTATNVGANCAFYGQITQN